MSRNALRMDLPYAAAASTAHTAHSTPMGHVREK